MNNFTKQRKEQGDIMAVELNAVWTSIVTQLLEEDQPIPAVINTFISPLRPYSYNSETRCLTVQAPSDTVRDFFAKRFKEKLCSIAQLQFGEPELRLEVFSQNEPERTLGQEARENRQPNGLIDKYTFENFVRGKSNELAFSACMYAAESAGRSNFESPAESLYQNHYNPLFIYGGVGLGKTHLMHSVGNYAMHFDPSLRVIYTTAENLMNEFIHSIKERKNQEFRDKYRTIDMLLVDDIQFLADKEGTQDEFFHTFNALYNANKQIVITSDKPPSELVKFHERLQSRFDNGTTVDISAPDFETRTAILQKKLEVRGLRLNPEVVHYIAKNISSNIRALEGALNTVAVYAKLANTAITVDVAAKALKGKLAGENTPQELTVGLIQDIVAKHYFTTKDELISKKRTQNITYARHIAMYLCRMLMDSTHVQIGQDFGKRDHTSVIYACNKVAYEIEQNAALKQTVYELEKKIKGE